jgi:hypothetical protein
MLKFIKQSQLAILLFILLNPMALFATDYQDYLFLHSSNKCSNYFEYFEQKHNIPTHLLRSISTVESGRWHSKSKLYLTWPWAVNQAGKAYYFETKSQAIKAVKKMLEQGITNIDIGCMQINLHHHPSAFLNLSQAFDPKDNIGYASYFLKKNYNQSGDWFKAVATYHSQLPCGKTYADKVFKIHSNYINGKVAIAPCVNTVGKLTSCNDATNSKIDKEETKEILPLDSRNTKLYPRKKNKNNKRRKSVMILYSTDSELMN